MFSKYSKLFIKIILDPINLVSIILFLFYIPLIAKVNFMQNDDWNRTTSIVRFLSGDTSLLQVTSTTFYTQGILGFLFSMIFGWQRLPYLTFIISVLNFYLLSPNNICNISSIAVTIFAFAV